MRHWEAQSINDSTLFRSPMKVTKVWHAISIGDPGFPGQFQPIKIDFH